MHPAKATAAAVTTLIGIGAATVAAARYAGAAALNSSPRRPPPGDPGVTVHATAPGRITLTRDLTTLRPGVYGLEGAGADGERVHAVVGPVLEEAPHEAHTVVRRLKRVTRGSLEPGTTVRLTPYVHTGDPGSALGLDFENTDVMGELGALPAWFVPGSRATWVITVHGLDATREHPLNVLAFLHRHRMPVLDLAYRGDAGAPRSPDGLGHLGDSEWRDLDAAIRHAVRHGADRVILYGWSTGAAMALRAATSSSVRHHVSGLVLDSPVLDWEATVRALARARRTPGALLPLVVRAAQGSTGAHGDRLRAAADPDGLRVPALIIHGPGDTVAPWGPSRALAQARPDVVTLHTVPDAAHAAMWNADPAGYEEVLRRFLTPLM
ncbi:alpha/beta hydrolase family protein [Streptomyces sp. CA-294286]|uniref:alpha/beta hydrolase family protein n=1 Tax=Streptomyces sp. CA-294286 TaxID=3240070 RepID=UPI003D8BEEC5